MDETILVNYLQGECNDEEAARVEAWCEEGSENRKTLEQLYYTLFVGERIAVMNTVDTEASLDQFKSAIREKEKKAKRKSISIRWGRYATVAAAFLTGLVFAGGIAWGLLSNKLSDYEVITAAGQRAQTVLPDGSKVWLNASSKIVYHNSLWSSDRQIDLSGEAYFEVESDKEHPFIVKTKQLTVEATGTAFNVNAYAPDHVAAVTLVKGKVAVTLDQKKTISLSPGEKIDYNLATSLYNVNKTNTYKWCSWKDGILIFRDDPLEYVFKRLGQTYNVEFILKDAELGKYSYKATFEGESLNEILRLLEMSAPIRCKEVSNRNTNNEKFEKQRIEVSRTMQ